jgi:hypothetical protein
VGPALGATSAMAEPLVPSGSRGFWDRRHFPGLLQEPRCRRKNGIRLLEERIAFFYSDRCGWSKDIV